MPALRTPSAAALLLALAACTDPAAPAVETATAGQAPTPSAAASSEAGLTSVTLKVEGMVCEGCQNTIQSEVGKLEGVKSCTASHEAGEARVEFDPTKIDRATIAAKIAELGYTVPGGG